tara:strand:+ start:999 stop:1301 length:303 start_codon:yes stop_codon:yes gene_type:complete
MLKTITMEDKEFESHMMYKGKEAIKADTKEKHLELKEDGYGHDSPAPFKMNGFPVHAGISPMAFKGADSSNSSCWKGYKKVGTKKSPSGTGKTVNDCKKI